MHLNEVEELFDSVSPENINLKSFETKDTLSDKIWNDEGMKANVRKRLLNIGMKFIESLKIDWAMPKDIVVVGSIAGFNWSKYSDIDLHILYDFSEVNENEELVKNYFDTIKDEWNNKHDELSIYGYEVETYVQDIHEENASDGIYSLIKDRWIKVPTTKDLKLNKKLICMQAAKLINAAEELEKNIDGCHSVKMLKSYKEELDELYTSITQGRRDGLASDGEGSTGNIVFKVLRRSGHLGMLRELKNKVYDKINSIE